MMPLCALLIAASVATFSAPAGADVLPDAASAFTEPLKLTFEILPEKPGTRLPDDLRKIEGARLQIEEFDASGGDYLRMTLTLPLPDGDRRERVVFFGQENGRLRMLGFHSMLRRPTGPEGQTVVFASGGANPLQGRTVSVPGDAYSRLGLFAALRGLAAERKKSRVSLWTDERLLPAEISPEGTDTIFLFGSDVATVKLKLTTGERSAADSFYWFDAESPHSFLQYEGPADFMTAEAADARVILRATSSSDHSRRLLQRLVPKS
jgi:hypothetical protein